MSHARMISILIFVASCTAPAAPDDPTDPADPIDHGDEAAQAVTSGDRFSGFASFNLYDGVPASATFCNLDPAQFGFVVTALRTDLANAYQAAHGQSACGLCAKVTSNGQTVIARIIDHSNDFTNNGGKRFLDLSLEAFSRIGNPDSGFIPVDFTIQACP
ncbi:MAG TPA: RlpA-like double-psi beta-barrel domain-containing protein [Kofleriaceae bacterium]|nr:RlpA-like double-psi beta-barrel domain-containing protein [Kofleriaceae bacterium]